MFEVYLKRGLDGEETVEVIHIDRVWALFSPFSDEVARIERGHLLVIVGDRLVDLYHKLEKGQIVWLLTPEEDEKLTESKDIEDTKCCQYCPKDILRPCTLSGCGKLVCPEHRNRHNFCVEGYCADET